MPKLCNLNYGNLNYVNYVNDDIYVNVSLIDVLANRCKKLEHFMNKLLLSGNMKET